MSCVGACAGNLRTWPPGVLGLWRRAFDGGGTHRVNRLSALALLMLGVFADDHHAALALDDLALFADGFHGRFYLHADEPPFEGRLCGLSPRRGPGSLWAFVPRALISSAR